MQRTSSALGCALLIETARNIGRARIDRYRRVARPPSRQAVAKLVDGDRIVFTPKADRSWTFVERASVGNLLQGDCLSRILHL